MDRGSGFNRAKESDLLREQGLPDYREKRRHLVFLVRSERCVPVFGTRGYAGTKNEACQVVTWRVFFGY